MHRFKETYIGFPSLVRLAERSDVDGRKDLEAKSETGTACTTKMVNKKIKKEKKDITT